MNVKIGEKYVVTSNGHGFTLNEVRVKGPKSKNPGTEYRKVVGEYSEFSHAVYGMLRNNLLNSGAETLADVLKELREIRELLEAELSIKSSHEGT